MVRTNAAGRHYGNPLEQLKYEIARLSHGATR